MNVEFISTTIFLTFWTQNSKWLFAQKNKVPINSDRKKTTGLKHPYTFPSSCKPGGSVPVTAAGDPPTTPRQSDEEGTVVSVIH